MERFGNHVGQVLSTKSVDFRNTYSKKKFCKVMGRFFNLLHSQIPKNRKGYYTV